MVFVISFLADVRERHSEYSKTCLDATFRVDSFLERQLRILSGDRLGNDLVIIPAEEVSIIERAIYYCADVVAMRAGIVLLILVMVAWIVAGPLLKWSSNWWLLVCIYPGLVGLNDGFVLRNVQAKLRDRETE